MATSAFLLRPNDKIIILQKSNDLEGKMVSISGAVKLPGKFEMWKDLSLRDVILMAGGLKESAFLQKGYIYRTKPDLTKEILNFKVEKENDFLTLDEIKLSNNNESSCICQMHNLPNFIALKLWRIRSCLVNLTIKKI